MIKQILRNGKCAKCGCEQDFLVIEGVNFASEESNRFIDFSLYSAFKNPCVNICENCGYIGFDLTQNQEPYAVFNQNDIKDAEGIFVMDIIFHKYFENSPFDIKSVQVLAKIYDLHEFSFNKFLRDNLRKKTKQEENLVFLHKTLIEQVCEACKLYLQVVDNKNNFVKCLYVELLASTQKTNEAKEILNTLNIADDLKDYLLECIELGGEE